MSIEVNNESTVAADEEELARLGRYLLDNLYVHPEAELSIILVDEEAMEKLKKCTKCHFNAPCAMLVCYNKDECWTRKYDGEQSGMVDASIVTTHMMLAAQNEGVGTCWVMHFDPAKMKEEFNIPDNYIPHALLVMGYPHEDSEPLDMHAKVRPLQEVVFYDKF